MPTEVRQVANWMVATGMISELKEQSAIRSRLGHDDYRGQQAWTPEGKRTEDFQRGLTTGEDVAKMMRDFIGCSTKRELIHSASLQKPLEKILKLTVSGALERGEVVCIMNLSNRLWEIAKTSDLDATNEIGLPDHWARLHGIVENDGGMLEVRATTTGSGVETRTMSTQSFRRLTFEFIFGTLTVQSSSVQV